MRLMRVGPGEMLRASGFPWVGLGEMLRASGFAWDDPTGGP